MAEDYSQMYNTQPNFNKTVVEDWVKNRRLENLQHWFQHGTPHKKLATVAFESAVQFNFIEAMELVWNSGWVSKKPLLSVGWYAAKFKMLGPKTQPAEASELWLFEKTYHSKEVTKADTITLNAQILVELLHRHETDRWDIHVNMLPDLTGKAYKDLGIYASYAAGFNTWKNEEEKKRDYTKQIARFKELSNRNVYQDDWTVSELLINEFEYAFFTIMNQDQIGLTGKPLFMMFTRIVSFYKVYRCLKISVEQYNKEMDLILNAFKRWKLPESVTFTAKEIKETYYGLFDIGQGYIPITAQRFMGTSMLATQLPYIDKRNPVDTAMYAGDVWFGETDFLDKKRREPYVRFLDPVDKKCLKFREDFKKLL
jgi:hypothetical protein